MSWRDVYFDTEVFSYFVFNPESQEELKYHPVKGDYDANISFIVIEEFIHQMQDENWDKWDGTYETFDKVWLEYTKRKTMFKNEPVDTNELMTMYERVITKLSRDTKGEFESSPLDSMDVLHLCFAELKGCRILYTTDGGYNCKDLERISDLLENITTVIILNYDGDQITQETEKTVN